MYLDFGFARDCTPSLACAGVNKYVVGTPLWDQLASLTLAELAIILLPIDAANGSGSVQCDESWSDLFCGSLDMAAAWYTVFMLIFIFALFIVPYTIFFYEEDDSLALT